MKVIYNETGNLLSEKTFSVTYQDNPVTTPAKSFFNWYTYVSEVDGNGYPYQRAVGWKISTMYELKTAKKTQSTVYERYYQPGNTTPVEKQIQTFYESNYHHQPTRIQTTDSKLNTVEKKIKYAFDFRVPVFENLTNCASGNSSTDFLNYFNSVYTSGGYYTQFVNCSNGADAVNCYASTITNWWTTVFNTRKNYIICRKTNYTNISPLNQYQLNHDQAKTAAGAELKSILWLQDAYMNTPVETTEWKAGNLVKSDLHKI